MPSNHLILSSPSSPAFNLFQHQGLFQGVSSSHQVARVLEFISFSQLPVWHCLIPIDVCLTMENFNVPHFIFQQRISHCPGFSGDTVVKKQQQQQQQQQTLPTIARDARDVISILGREDSPGGGNGNPPRISLPAKSHRQRSLVGYSPQGYRESDTTE